MFSFIKPLSYSLFNAFTFWFTPDNFLLSSPLFNASNFSIDCVSNLNPNALNKAASSDSFTLYGDSSPFFAVVILWVEYAPGKNGIFGIKPLYKSLNFVLASSYSLIPKPLNFLCVNKSNPNNGESISPPKPKLGWTGAGKYGIVLPPISNISPPGTNLV